MQKKVFFCNFKLLPLFVNFKLYSNFSKKSLFNTVLFVYTEFGSLTTSQLMEKIKGLQNLAYQLGLDEGMHCTTLSKCKTFGLDIKTTSLLQLSSHHCLIRYIYHSHTQLQFYYGSKIYS